MISFTRLGSHGCLGNQMFQYAALLGVHERLGHEIAIPAPARHELGRTFLLSAPTLTWRGRRSLRGLLHDDRLGYRPALETVADRTDLLGYFQSPRHFPADAVLRREFRLRPEHHDPAAARLDALRRDAATLVGVSVRRGDYLVNPHFVPLTETGFYDRAISELAAPGTRFVISSDDPAWCRRHVAGPRFTGPRFRDVQFEIVDDLGDGAQFGVLTGCDHLVIANGTFAWWAAWCNPRPHRRVLVPDTWMAPNHEFPEHQRERPPTSWEERCSFAA